MTEQKEQDPIDAVQNEFLFGLWTQVLKAKRSQKATLGLVVATIFFLFSGVLGLEWDVVDPYIIPTLGLFVFLIAFFDTVEKRDLKKAA